MGVMPAHDLAHYGENMCCPAREKVGDAVDRTKGAAQSVAVAAKEKVHDGQEGSGIREQTR